MFSRTSILQVVVSRPGAFTGAAFGAGAFAYLLVRSTERAKCNLTFRDTREREGNVSVSIGDPTYLDHLLLELAQEGVVVVQSLHPPISYRLKRTHDGEVFASWFTDSGLEPAALIRVDEDDWSVPTRLESETPDEWCDRAARGFIRRVLSGDTLHRVEDPVIE